MGGKIFAGSALVTWGTGKSACATEKNAAWAGKYLRALRLLLVAQASFSRAACQRTYATGFRVIVFVKSQRSPAHRSLYGVENQSGVDGARG